MSLSKNKIKYIQSLKEKKFRIKHKNFIAEGEKLVLDLLETCKCKFIFALPSFLSIHTEITADEIIEVSEKELKKITSLKTAPDIIAIFYKPEYNLNEIDLENNLSLVLDGVQDPGNVGTIIRIADWFGIKYVFCNENTADAFNPKTVQATMGAIARVKVIYTDINELLLKYKHLPAFGTFLDGNNIYKEQLSKNGFIVMGSEGKGINPDVENLITNRIYIPSYPNSNNTSESLNVAVAAAITCSEFRRRSN